MNIIAVNPKIYEYGISQLSVFSMLYNGINIITSNEYILYINDIFMNT